MSLFSVKNPRQTVEVAMVPEMALTVGRLLIVQGTKGQQALGHKLEDAAREILGEDRAEDILDDIFQNRGPYERD